MENRPASQPVKSTVPRANLIEPQTDKKPTKTTTATTTNKSITQKVTNPSKPIVNAPVKPMPTKRTLSPMDDRLSDEECKLICSIFLLNNLLFYKIKFHQIHQQMFLHYHQILHLYKPMY
jgi:hypothetical protein